jgi:hypothetical protein
MQKKTQISFTEDSRDKSKQITDRSVGEKKISRKHHRRPTRHHDTPPSFRRRRALCCVLIGGLPVAADERLPLARMSATRHLLVGGGGLPAVCSVATGFLAGARRWPALLRCPRAAVSLCSSGSGLPMGARPRVVFPAAHSTTAAAASDVCPTAEASPSRASPARRSSNPLCSAARTTRRGAGQTLERSFQWQFPERQRNFCG